jgi:hypothetical protein
MKVKINARFATVEDTAKALGVPLGRARKLARLVDPSRYRNRSVTVDSKVSQTHDWTSLTAASLERKNGSRPHAKSGPLKRKTRKKNRCLKKEAYACQSLQSLALMFS